MIKVIFSLIFASMVFSGCSSDESSISTTDNTISTSSQWISKFDEIKTTEVKSEYETTTEYNNRMATFIEEQGNVTYVFDLRDEYDANTQTLVLDESSIADITGANEESFSNYYWEVLFVDNMNVFPYNLEYATSSSSYQSRVFLRTNMTPEKAQELDGTFKLEISVTYQRLPTITTEYSSSIV